MTQNLFESFLRNFQNDAQVEIVFTQTYNLPGSW